MSWSVTIARVAGSEIRIHLTFLILLLWIGVSAWFAGGTAAAVDSVLFIVAVFARVILHEYDHLEGVLFFDRLKSLEDLFVVTVDSEGKHVHTPYLRAVQRAETAAAKSAAKAAPPE